MEAQILSTGDEVISGDITDTNSAWLCARLREMGITVTRITAVGDDEKRIAAALEDISKSAGLCLATGGLGPTSDDLTAKACAAALGEDLALNSKALASMAVFFRSKGFELNRDNEKQAYLPASATLIENRWGTAPGFRVRLGRCDFCFLPGVPNEMKAMFDVKVKPLLASLIGERPSIMTRKMTVFGLPESRVEALLSGFSRKFAPVRLGFRATFPLIIVKLALSSTGLGPGRAEDRMEAAAGWVYSKLDRKIVSRKGLSLEEEVGRLLVREQKTLSLAESCTGGMIADRITRVAGSSRYFLMSAVTYSNEAKTRILDVSADTLQQVGAVDERTAVEMAAGARKRSGADFAVSTTGIAGPGGGSDPKPVGTVCIAVAGPDRLVSKTYHFPFKDRGQNKKLFTACALELLRREIIARSATDQTS